MDTRATLDLITDGVLGLLWIVAVARVTRLLTVDAVTDFIRGWVYNRWTETSTQAYFSTCPWCVSIWVGFATGPVLLHYISRDQWALPLIAFVASYYAGVSAAKFETDDDDIEIITED